MSIVYTADVFCDAEDCAEWTYGPVMSKKPPSFAVARKEARTMTREGWVFGKNGKDFCPDHAEEAS